MKKIIIAIVLFFASSSASAANWVYVGSSINYIYFFDSESVELVDSDAISAWIKSELKTGGTPVMSDGRAEYSVIFKFNAKINEKKKRIVSMCSYDRNHNVIFSFYEKDNIVQYSEVVPDTVSETWRDALLDWCRKSALLNAGKQME